MKLGLRHVSALLTALRSPQRRFPSVQIAGTNGKGSTAVMLDSISRAAGIRVGLFTSPHLISITERIRINGEQISESEFGKLAEQVKTAAEKLVKTGKLPSLPTFFEQVTAIALLAFRNAKVDLAILEVGLGGRLDATTAASSQLVGITSIDIDHERYLGHRIEEIAAEKAAIIRPGVTAIIAPQHHPMALFTIQKRCEEVGVSPIVINPEHVRITDYSTNRFDLRSRKRRYQSLTLGLKGRHQISNASCAVALAEALEEQGFKIPKKAITAGLTSAHHAGRLEYWIGKPKNWNKLETDKPTILFDGAHNPAAAAALARYLSGYRTTPITMIFGAMADKNFAGMARPLFWHARHLILTKVNDPRAAAPKALKKYCYRDEKHTVHQTKSVAEAWQVAQRITTMPAVICVTGSLHLIGEVQRHLQDSGVANDYFRSKGRWSHA
jgi:dihydrofolate synthase/folylpolyglutamate synthase